MRLLAAMAAALALTALPVRGQTPQDARDCARCHGELEFLRQHAASLDEARRMRVTLEEILASAHTDYTCAECHTGFNRWPHPEGGTTESCASCHQEEDDLWHQGVHATSPETGEDPVECAACHSLHRIATAEELREGPAMLEMNARCVDCHEASALPAWDPHLDTVSCAGCHAPHETRDVDEPSATVGPSNQPATCGACHEETAAASMDDTHGRALADEPLRGLATVALLGADTPPTCTSCHGAHGMRAAEDSLAAEELVNACAGCHEDYTERFYGTYHGKATALGSHIVAACADCHLAHAIYPADDPASSVHTDNLVETCASCHEASRPAFVEYDSHPDPLDRGRNAPLFFSFVFMNTLLIGVLIVFGLHTLLWWVRIWLDHRKGGHGEASHG